VEHGGEPLSRYEVRLATDTGELRDVGRPRLFGTSRVLAQQRLFALDTLGERGWLKAMRLEGYAPRNPRRPEGLEQALTQPPPSMPENKEACKNGGYKGFGFRNQGQCIRAVNQAS
jgi:hypothetical protein